MPKILGIICTYGFADITQDVIEMLASWKSQKGDYQLDVVVSDNRSSEQFRKKLHEICKGYGYKCILTDGDYTVFMTMNLAIKLFAQEYDYVIFCSEDIFFTTINDIQLMLNDFKDPSIGSITTRSSKKFIPDKFNEYYGDKFGITLDKKIREHSQSPYILLISEVVCLCICMMKKDFLKMYEYRLIDKLVHSNFEQHFFLMLFAVGMACGVCTNTSVEHRSFPKSSKMKRKKFGSVNKKDYCNIFDLFLLGKSIGYGFSTKNDFEKYLPDKTMYKNNKHLNPKILHKFLLDNLFLDSKTFNYDLIKYKILC